MSSFLPVYVLLVLQLTTLACDSRPSPRECSRLFYFDFDAHLEQGVGGVWQGNEGHVIFSRGKAWFDGRGSLVYPFFSHNDLRSGFAFSFKIHPTSIENGRVAILTNGLESGASTLTVFHNRTVVGIKVIEISEGWPLRDGDTSSRNVQLSVDVSKYLHRTKRSASENTASPVIYSFVSHSEDDRNGANGGTRNHSNGSQTTLESVYPATSGARTGSSSSSAHASEDSADRFNESRSREEDNTSGSQSKPKQSVIAIRKLFRQSPKNYAGYHYVKPSHLSSTENQVVSIDSRTDVSRDPDVLDDTKDRNDSVPSKEVMSTFVSLLESSWNNMYRRADSTENVDGYSRTGHPTTTESLKTEEQTTTLPVQVKADDVEIGVPRRKRPIIVPDVFAPYRDEDPNEIRVLVAQDNGILSLQVGDSPVQRTPVATTEHLKAPRSALRVGAGDGLQAYRGSFDEFIMYDCTPENFFNEPS